MPDFSNSDQTVHRYIVSWKFQSICIQHMYYEKTVFRTNCEKSFLSSGRVCVRTSFIPEDFTPLPVPRDSNCMDRSTQAAQRGVICMSVYVFV